MGWCDVDVISFFEVRLQDGLVIDIMARGCEGIRGVVRLRFFEFLWLM